jgi:hypothetical protein
MLQRMRETVDMRLRHDRYVMVAIRDVHDGMNPEAGSRIVTVTRATLGCGRAWLCKYLSLRRCYSK